MTEEQKKEAIRKFLENSETCLKASYAMCVSGSNIALVNSSGKRAKPQKILTTENIDKLKNYDRH